MQEFCAKLDETQARLNSLVCVGLDSQLDKIPETAQKKAPGITMHDFNCAIVDATIEAASAYKPNIAFYEAQGSAGHFALRDTIAYIRRFAPDTLVILDMKRADIGNTNNGYVEAAFDYFGADAITVNPYFGGEALKPFLDRQDKGVFVLCRTSNRGAGEFQDLLVPIPGNPLHMPLYQYVAHQVSFSWNTNGNCGLVVGATAPEELAHVRSIISNKMPILSPGIGKQGGDIEKTVKAGVNSRGRGLLINSSSAIIFASNGPDFAGAARAATIELRDQINQYR